MADYISHEAPAQESSALAVTIPQKLIGRDAVLGKIYTSLRENKPFLIYGAPGVGKSALAATLAAAYTEQPGGVLWINVDNTSLEELIVRVGRAYEVHEISNSENPASMVGAVASTLTQHKPLIVMDGKLNEAATRAFISRCADKLPVLLVNQLAFGENIWPTLHLEPLEAGHAASLFKQVAGLDTETDADIDRLVEKLHYVPMAITLAASTVRATKQTPAQYESLLSQIPGYDQAEPSLVALTAAFRSLNTALQGLILMLGATFRGEASSELLSRVGNAPQDTIEQVMRILTYQHLIETTQRYGTAYYRLHTVTHKFAQTLAGEQRLNDLQGKLRDALIAYARQYSSQSDELYDHLALMMDNFLAAAEWASGRNDVDMPNQLVVALMQAGDFIHERGYVYELLRLRGMASTSTTAFPASPELASLAASFDEDVDIDTPGFVGALFGDDDEEDDDLIYDEEDEDVEDFDFDQEEDEEEEDFDIEDEGEDEDDIFSGAFIPDVPTEDEDEETLRPAAAALPEGDINALRMALARAKQLSNRDRQIEILKALGKAQVEQGQQNEAISTYSEIIELYDDEDEDEELLEALDSVSTLLVQTDGAQAAIMYANRGIQLADTLGDGDTQMHMYLTLGNSRQELGESAAADMAYSQALEIARQRGDGQNEAIILYKLGYAKLDNSDAEGASATWEQALTLFRSQQKRDYEGKVMGGLGTAYGDQGRWSEAVRFHTSALHIAREVGDKTDEMEHLTNLAYAYVQAGDLGQAVLRYRQALHLAYEGDDKEQIVSTIVELAGLLSRSPRHLAIARLLVEEAALFEPNDRDVISLRGRINTQLSGDTAADQKAVSGTAYDYAANAYKLLES